MLLHRIKNVCTSGNRRHDASVMALCWAFLSVLLLFLALPLLHAPGLYYDEAVNAGMAKDFVTGTRNVHMLGTQAVSLFGRPFPLLLQSYAGALKSWMFIPSLMVWDATLPVLRLTSLGWSLIVLFVFMLWARELLGCFAALLAALLLALDPSFFFLSVIDWGPITPGFLCRVGGFLLAVLWWKEGKTRYGVAAAFMLGLGFFSKIDFVVVLVGCGLAVIAGYHRELLGSIRKAPGRYGLFCLSFLVGAGPMTINLALMLKSILTGQSADRHREMLEKFNTLVAMYDGSYMQRLMQAGGRFDVMYELGSSLWTPFGIVVVASAGYLLFHVLAKQGFPAERRRSAIFILVSGALITVGVFLLPNAARMHHSTLVYPFPHLAIAVTVASLWQTASRRKVVRALARALAIGIVAVVLGGNVTAIWKTRHFMASTGGKGFWSEALTSFAREANGHADLTVVSTDWGFNEQLLYLTKGVNLAEPFWNTKEIDSLAPNAVYLVHPPEYSLFPQGRQFLAMAVRQGPQRVSIQPYTDRQGDVAFYAVRLREGQ